MINNLTQEIDMLREENRILHAKLERTCEWKENYESFEEVVWSSQCGEDYCYGEVPLTECSQKYCQGCGGKLIIIPVQP